MKIFSRRRSSNEINKCIYGFPCRMQGNSYRRLEMSYFRSIYLEERVIHIEDPAGVFATLFVGEKEALLFDTGYGFSNLSRFVKTLTNFPLTVVCSHCHFDHVLGSADFQELYLHEADIPYYEYYTSKEMRTRVYDEFTAKGGKPCIGRADYLAKSYPRPKPLTAERWDLGGISLRVVYLPGHTKGSIGLLDEGRRRIYLGDAANQRVLLYLPGAASARAYEGSLETLLGLDFADMVFSHNEQPYPKEELLTFLECIRHYREEDTTEFTLDAIPEKKGRYFEYGHMGCGDAVAVVCPGKED